MPSASNIRAGAAYIEIYAKDHRLVKGLNAASDKLKAFGAGITSVGKRLSLLGAGLTAPLVASAKVFADMGSDLLDMSQRTGVSVEALSELGYAAEQTGTDMATLEAGLRRMQRTILDASDGMASAVDALTHLGLSVDQLQGLSPEDQFKLIADRLSQVEDATMRAGLAMVLLGRSGTRLLPLFHDGAQGIEELQQQARELGLTISTADAAAAEALGDQLATLWTVVKRGVFAIGSALEPLLSQLADTLTRVATTISAWISENRGLVVSIFKMGVGALAAGAALIILGTAIAGLGAVLGGIATLITTAGAAVGTLGTILASLLSPIGLVITGVGSLAAYIINATGAGGAALAWLGDQFGVLKETALAAWQGIGAALAAGDLAQAAKIVWLTLKLEWQRGINFLTETWIGFKDVFMSIWQGAVFGAARLMTHAWAALQIGWVETIDGLADAWDLFIGALMKGWNHFAGYFQKVWARIKGLFGDTDAEEEIARINAEVAQSNEQIDERRNDRVSQREQNRKAIRSRIDKDWTGSLGALDDRESTAQAQREARYQAELAASQAELARARREWQDSLTQASALPAETHEPEKKKRRQFPTLEEFESLLGETRQKIDVAGSFNALAARGLGADSLSERTAKATEQVAAHTKALAREAQHGGLVFG